MLLGTIVVSHVDTLPKTFAFLHLKSNYVKYGNEKLG
jgi:hypothetical protein